MQVETIIIKRTLRPHETGRNYRMRIEQTKSCGLKQNVWYRRTTVNVPWYQIHWWWIISNFTAENISFFAVSSKSRAKDCFVWILSESRLTISSKSRVQTRRILLFGLRYFVGAIRISPPHLLLTTIGPYILLPFLFSTKMRDFFLSNSNQIFVVRNGSIILHRSFPSFVSVELVAVSQYLAVLDTASMR